MKIRTFLLLLYFLGDARGINILLIVVDDLRPAIGIYNDREAHTPNIDLLAKESITFHRAYAQQALCAPSRNSFLTSRRPNTLKLFDFYSYWRTMAGNYTTLPQYLKENKYETISVGKVFHPGVSSNFTDDYPASWSDIPWHPITQKYKNFPVCYNDGKWSVNIVCPVRLEEQPNHTLPDIESLQRAKEYLSLKKSQTQPFFLAVGFQKPHVPFKFPRKYLDYHPLEKIRLPSYKVYPPGLPSVAWNPWCDIRWREDIAALNLTIPFEELPDDWIRLMRQSYFASVTYIDDLIGELLLSLKESQMEKNTVVVLIGDHGWSLGEHGEWSKFSNFDVSVKIPFIIRVPNITTDFHARLFHDGYHTKELVELVDLFPTLVEAAGLELPPYCEKNITWKLCTEGISLLPLIKYEVSKKDNRFTTMPKPALKAAAFSQYPRPGIQPACHPDSDRPKLHEIKIMGYSLRTKRHRYTEWVSWNHKTFSPNWSDVKGVELYDHFIDPEENLNIAGRPELKDLEKKLQTMLLNKFN